MEKERSLKQIVISVMRKRQGYTSDFGGFYFLAEDYFSATAFEILAEVKAALTSTRPTTKKIALRHWSEDTGEHKDGVVCGVNCGCDELECKF